MPESKLTEDQKDFYYSFLNYFHDISTELRNADMLMHSGKFFDAMDKIRQCQQNALIGEEKVKECVEKFKKNGNW